MARNKKPFLLIVRRNNNNKSSAYNKYYAERYLPQTLTTRGLANHLIAHGLIAQRAEVEEALMALAECIPEVCTEGHSVKLDGIGVFRVTLSTKGTDTAAEFNANSHIKGVHIRLIPEAAGTDNITSKQFKNRCSFQVVGYTDNPNDPIKELNYQSNP